MGDIASTIVDFAERGFVAVDGTDSGWTVQVVPARMPVQRQQAMLAYERELLATLPMPSAGQPPPVLSDLVATLGPGLNRVRAELIRETVHQGWVHRWSHDQLTDSGERFVEQVSAFGRKMRGLSGEDAGALAGPLLPYALRFHLVARDRIPLAAFAAAWAEAFTDLPGWRPPEYQRPERHDEWYNSAKPSAYVTGGLAFY